LAALRRFGGRANRSLEGRLIRRTSRHLAVLLLLASPAAADEVPPAEDTEIRKVIADYGRAIETKDLDLFKSVKPNLTDEEVRRTRTAFQAVKSQVVKINVVSLEVHGEDAVVKVSRRDTINGSLVSSFPQTFRLARGKAGWSIQEIGK
jgi:hypothetical protein